MGNKLHKTCRIVPFDHTLIKKKPPKNQQPRDLGLNKKDSESVPDGESECSSAKYESVIKRLKKSGTP